MCVHCASQSALADEVAELRALLGLSGRLTDQRRIERAFGLSRQPARLLQVLYDAGGKVVPRQTLDSVVLSPARYEDGSDMLKVLVCRVRAVIGKDVIDTAAGGYAITQAGRALVAGALRVADSIHELQGAR